MVLSICAFTLGFAAVGLLAEYDGLEDRREAVEWIENELPDGATILTEAYSPWIDPNRFRVLSVDLVALNELPSRWDYIFITERGSGRFVRQAGKYPVEAQVIAAIRLSTCEVASFAGQMEVRSSTC